MPRSSSEENYSRKRRDDPRPSAISDPTRSTRHRRTSSDESNDEPHDRRRRRDESHRDRSDRSRRGRRDDAWNDSARDREDRNRDGDRRHRERSFSPDQHRRRHRSRSPPSKRRRRSHSASRSPVRKARGPLPSQDESFRGELAKSGVADERPPEKQKPNFKPTGLLAKEANTVAGSTTVLKYHEPAEGRKPPSKEPWRMYVFNGKDLIDTVHLHERSAWLMGRDQKVADLLLEHSSVSKQHAVVQFRQISTTNEFGDKKTKVKPYLIDLESANATRLNGKKVEASRFIELVDQDIITFGDSDREYVMMLPSSDT